MNDNDHYDQNGHYDQYLQQQQHKRRRSKSSDKSFPDSNSLLKTFAAQHCNSPTTAAKIHKADQKKPIQIRIIVVNF